MSTTTFEETAPQKNISVEGFLRSWATDRISFMSFHFDSQWLLLASVRGYFLVEEMFLMLHHMQSLFL